MMPMIIEAMFYALFGIWFFYRFIKIYVLNDMGICWELS